ncbi:hypothetical protein O6H91_14G067700 [Diphasiastrum complanatum]|uniref:Uncharacterized protein n=1 Tax=Diphasiastrum complanatum TaxID=34168 RepID=A0ACC2BRF9_DIPCM|nr:hypothetical protein O6H91_14G067700 [Diphasiastrum complanatum]
MAIKEKVQLSWLFSLVITFISLRICFSLDSEGFALLAFRRGIREDPHGIFANWNSSNDSPCDWHGVTCSGGHVKTLKLVDLSLHGTLAVELEQLGSLQHLLLSGNKFSGGIPEQLGGLKKLQILDLGNNQLTGGIPSSFGKLIMLEVLILEHNLLEGIIPAQFGNLVSLKELSLKENFLTGTISGGQFGASTFYELQLSSTFNRIWSNKESFEGLCQLRGLKKINISWNFFTGRLPPCMFHFTRSNFELNCFQPSIDLTRQRSAEECGTRFRQARSRKLLFKSESNPADVDGSSPQPSPSSQPKLGYSSSVTAAHSVPQKATQHSSTWVYGLIGALPGFVAFFLVLLAVGVFCHRRRSASVSPWKAGMSGQLQKTFVTVSAFRRAELQSACEDFSNIIETSPDSVVFKGTLSNGTEVAVSSLKIPHTLWTSNSELFFQQKIQALARMKHKQLVSLVGYCAEEDPFERMLVFEYAPNGTLFDQLHNGYSETLDWGTRMRIVMGAAYGLEYMHHELVPPISHSNFDSNAIHLTEDFAAKLADFGVFKPTAVKIKRRQRLSDFLYYDDLDCLDGYTVNFENDIFNFGVFLLEVLSGRTPYNETYGYLVEWALKYLRSAETIMEMVDPSLKAYNCQQVQALCDIIRLCIQSDPSKRPSMKEVTSMLSKALDISLEVACPKSSPLLWAELEILAPI